MINNKFMSDINWIALDNSPTTTQNIMNLILLIATVLDSSST